MNIPYSFPEDDDTFISFQQSIKSPETRKVWTRNLNEFMTFTKHTHYHQLLKYKAEQTEKQLKNYIIWKQNVKKTRPQSVAVKLTAVKHYYWINKKKDIDWDIVKSFLGETKRAVQDKPYTHQQIARILAVSPPKVKILVLSEAQGGRRIGAFAAMKIGDLTKIEDHGIYRVHVYPGATKDEYLTYFGPEATAEIDRYLDERRRAGEELTPESPLIRDDFTTETVNRPRFLTNYTLGNTVGRYLVKAGLRSVTPGNASRKENMRTHALRKFFKQQCRRAGVDPLVIEWLVGHRSGEAKIGITKLMLTYDPADEDELLSEYLKAVDNLTISEETRSTRKNVQMQKTIDIQDEALQRALDALNYLQERANATPTGTTT